MYWHLPDNAIKESAAAMLAASPLGRRLAVLELENPPPSPGPQTRAGTDAEETLEMQNPPPPGPPSPGEPDIPF